MNELFVAAILGLVEGITEFLPISSTGHLILFGHLLGWTGVRADTFEVFIQSGAMLAVLVHYRERFIGLVRPAPGGGFAGPRGIALLALATVPALVAALLFRKGIQAHLFRVEYVASAFVVGGIAILLLDRPGRGGEVTSLDAIGPRLAIGIGLFQCLALWPGISRSAATILGGMILGCDRKTSAEFSFFAAVPILLAAGAHEMVKNAGSLSTADTGIFAVGFLVSFVSALGVIRVLLGYVTTRTFAPFGWYRIAVGGAILLLWI